MDAALLALAVVAVLAGATAVVVARLRRRPRLTLDPNDLAELDAVGAAVLAEDRAVRTPALARRLHLLTGRGVPASRVEPTGIRGQWVVRFADATTLLVRERRAGDMALLAVRLQQRRVNLAAYELAPEGAWIDLAWRGGRVRALAVA